MTASSSRARVLVVEDEPRLLEVMVTALTARDYEVDEALTGRAAMDQVWSDGAPDVVLLDLGLPDVDGVALCREFRKSFANPIIVLTADAAEARKIAAFDAGADDYVTKPFSMPELLARLRVALRHRRAIASVVDPVRLEVGDLVIDTAARQGTAGDHQLTLGRKEFEILTLLTRNEGAVVTHKVVLNHVWGSPAAGSPESLRVHITNIRKKLGAGSRRPRIVTEIGVGYRLQGPDAA